MLPPTMRILARGTAGVLGAAALVAGGAGAVTRSPMVALNVLGFVGACAIGMALIFYAVVLERVGIHVARTAASVLVLVLASSALLMAIVLAALLLRADVRAEAERFGLHSVAGAAVLVVLVVLLAVLWGDRRR